MTEGWLCDEVEQFGRSEGRIGIGGRAREGVIWGSR